MKLLGVLSQRFLRRLLRHNPLIFLSILNAVLVSPSIERDSYALELSWLRFGGRHRIHAIDSVALGTSVSSDCMTLDLGSESEVV